MMLPMLLRLQDHAADTAHAAGALPAPFSPTTGLFFWTIIVFGALLFFLSKFVFPMIVKATVEREEKITAQLAEAEQMRAEANKVLDEHRELLAGARGEAQAIIAEARQAAERERAVAVEKTKAEQDELLARAKAEIAAEGERARAELRREVADLAIAAAGKVIEKQLDPAADRRIVEDYLSQIGQKS